MSIHVVCHPEKRYWRLAPISLIIRAAHLNRPVMNISFVTARKTGGAITRDDQYLADTLSDQGCRVVPCNWDDAEVEWAEFDAIVLRSCWDYHQRVDEFRAWLHRCMALPVWNPVPMVLENIHKSYLLDLQKKDVPVVDTRLIRSGQNCDLEQILSAAGWRNAVIKPAISATAHQTWLTRNAQLADSQDRLDQLLSHSDVLVQPFIPEVSEQGEYSFVFFGGELSHVVLKKSAAGDFRVQENFGGKSIRIEPRRDLIRQAEKVADVIPQPWLYARIDGVEVGGRFLVMEVELIEPMLFAELAEEAGQRFSSALLHLI